MMIHIERACAAMGVTFIACAYYELMQTFSLPRDVLALVRRVAGRGV